MTTLADRVQSDMVAAMKARDATTLSTLRLLKTAATLVQVEKQAPLTDDEYLTIIGRQAKMRREAAAEYDRAGRSESAQQEREEMAILERYLPAQVDDSVIRAALEGAILTTGATSPRQMGVVMASAMAELRGQADGSRVSALARELLSGDGH